VQGALGLPSAHLLLFVLLWEIGAAAILSVFFIIVYGTDASIRTILSAFKVHRKTLLSFSV
jgi:hypothetical protein